MSICYWGDKFYGIDRIENADLFDVDKEREVILDSVSQIDSILYEQLSEDADNTNFADIDLYAGANGIDDYISFLKKSENVVVYAVNTCNGNLIFFGIDYKLPWETAALKPQWEVDQDIYNAIKPILKDGVGLDAIKPRIQTYIINGADDYVTYYGAGK